MSNIHIPCLNCGYDLFGVGSESCCPECGSSQLSASRHPRLYSLAPSALGRIFSALLISMAIWLLFPATVLLVHYVWPAGLGLFDSLIMVLFLYAPPTVLAFGMRADKSGGGRFGTLILAGNVLALFVAFLTATIIPATSPAIVGKIIFATPLVCFQLLIRHIIHRIPSPLGVALCWLSIGVLVVELISWEADPLLSRLTFFARWQFVYHVALWGSVVISLLASWCVAIIKMRQVMSFVRMHNVE